MKVRKSDDSTSITYSQLIIQCDNKLLIWIAMSIWCECEFNANIMTISYNQWLIYLECIFQFVNYIRDSYTHWPIFWFDVNVNRCAIFISQCTCNAAHSIALSYFSNIISIYLLLSDGRVCTSATSKCTPEIDTFPFCGYLYSHWQNTTKKQKKKKIRQQ